LFCWWVGSYRIVEMTIMYHILTSEIEEKEISSSIAILIS